MLVRRVQAALMTSEHPSEDRDSALLRLGMGTSEADQSSGAVLAGGQGAEVCSHVAQVATGRKRGPLLLGRVLQAIVAVVRVVQTADRLPVLFDQSGGIELGVNHDGIRGGMAEQCLDDMHGGIVVQMFGGKHPPAVVREQHERSALGAPGFSNNGEFTNPAADGLNASGAGMADSVAITIMALEEDTYRSRRARALFQQVPVVAHRHGVAVIEPLYMANDLGQDAAEAVADGDNSSAIKLRRLDVQQVIDASIDERPPENVQGSQFAGFFDTQTALDK